MKPNAIAKDRMFYHQQHLEKMNKLLLLFLLIPAVSAQADELPWFEINCNLRSADYIVKGEILDSLGTIKVTRDYSLNKLGKQEIRIRAFGSPRNWEIEGFYRSLIGRSVVVFLKRDSSGQVFSPAWLTWELSTLWTDGETLKSVLQLVNPGGWALVPFYPHLSALEIEIRNWHTFQETFLRFRDYENAEDRVYYLQPNR